MNSEDRIDVGQMTLFSEKELDSLCNGYRFIGNSTNGWDILLSGLGMGKKNVWWETNFWYVPTLVKVSNLMVALDHGKNPNSPPFQYPGG